MDNILTIDDFTGVYSLGILAGSENEIRLNQLITDMQVYFLGRILQDREYNKLLDDCGTGVPVSTKWINFLDGVKMQVDNTHYIQYTGAKEAMKGYIAYFYLKNFLSVVTPSGDKIRDTRNSSINEPGRKGAEFYNKAAELVGFNWSFHYFYGNLAYQNTVYNYLYYNATIFPYWEKNMFRRFKQIPIL